MSEVLGKPIISVFGSHAPQPGSEDYETARKLGQLLAEAGYGVATGGYSGTMSAASQGASEAGGLVIGVSSAQVEATRNTVLNRWVDEHVRFETLEERLIYLVKNNVGMVVLPGGIGTLSEFALAWSFMQVGEMPRRPLVMLGELWSRTLAAFVNDRYVSSDHIDLVHVARSAESAVAQIRDFQ
jgi:uncharacterized protein (TIGR00730 family)